MQLLELEPQDLPLSLALHQLVDQKINIRGGAVDPIHADWIAANLSVRWGLRFGRKGQRHRASGR